MCYHPFNSTYPPMVVLFGRIDLRLSENPEVMVSMSFPPRIE